MFPPVVLASQSLARRRLLEGAGVEIVSSEAAGIDEAEFLHSITSSENMASADVAGSEAAAVSAAVALAEMKALRVSMHHPQALVVGGDQIVVRGSGGTGEWLGKPRDMEEARSQLYGHSGSGFMLATAGVVVRDCQRLWGVVERPRVAFRCFAREEVDEVLALQGELSLSAAGGCLLEGAGVRLVQRLEGDFFSLLGLPLLALLGFLREQSPQEGEKEKARD